MAYRHISQEVCPWNQRFAQTATERDYAARPAWEAEWDPDPDNPIISGTACCGFVPIQVVMNYVRGTYEDYSFNAAVGNAACLKCHEGIMGETIHSTDTGILVSHKDIIETGGKCMSCHSTVGHGDAVPFGSQTHPTMATCLTCHDDRIAPLDCDLCHVGKKPPSPSATHSTDATATPAPQS